MSKGAPDEGARRVAEARAAALAAAQSGYSPSASGRNPETGLVEVEAILPTAPDWTVGAEIDDSSGVAVIVGMTLRRKDHPAVGQRGSGPLTAPGGLTAAVIRSVSLSALVAQANFHLHVSQLMKGEGSRLVPDPLKGRQNPDLYYAVWASRYADAAVASRSPIADLAEKHNMKRSQVRDLIHKCRERKLLPDGQPGRPGGQLTAKAIEVLRETKASDETASKRRRRPPG